MNTRNCAAPILLLSILLSSCRAPSTREMPVLSPSPLPSPTPAPTHTAVVEITPIATGTPAGSPAPLHLSQLPPLSLAEFNARYSAGDLALSRDGKLMAVASRDRLYADQKSIWLWNVNDFTQSLAGYLLTVDELWSVAFHPEGARLAIGGTEKIMILDWKTGITSETIKLPGSEAVQLAFGKDNTLVWSSFADRVNVSNLRGEIKYSVHGEVGYEPASFALSPDGKVLITAELDGINLWDMTSGQKLEFREGPDGGIGIAPASVFSNKGDFLASTGCSEFIFEGCSSGKILIWRSDSNVPAVISVIHSSWIKVLRFSPNGESIASASADGSVKLLYLADGKIVDVPSLELPAELEPFPITHVWDMEFLSEGTVLAVSTNDGIQLLDIASVTWMPDLRFVLSFGRSYTITAGGDKLNLRAKPSQKGEIIRVLHTGESFWIADGPEIAEGYVWWNVEVEDGSRGWIVEMPGWYEFIP